LKITIIVAGDPTPNPHPGAIFSEVLHLEPEPFPFSEPVETGDEMAVTTVREVPSLGAKAVCHRIAVHDGLAVIVVDLQSRRLVDRAGAGSCRKAAGDKV
jgi:hypothetical protein